MADGPTQETGMPVFLSFGFRPFFFLGSLWAALAMALWIGMLSGLMDLPTGFEPVDWHAHAFIIGYLGAIVSGFLLTAVPNWTGRAPLKGWRLGFLVLLWVMGRLALTVALFLPTWLVALLDLSFLLLLTGIVAREIIAAGNWRNLVVVAMLLALIAGGGLFHWQVAQGEVAARSEGFRLMLSVAVMMISLIGGRIIPTFTRNWLLQQGKAARPAPPMAPFDKLTLGVTLSALILWVLTPWSAAAGPALIAMGLVQAVRLSRWSGWHGLSEPLVWVLHVGYAFIPLGAVVLGLSLLWPDAFDPASGQHLWMAGAIGLMTLAVMTRATLGHTGQALVAGPRTTGLYLLLIAAVLARLAAGLAPGVASSLHMVSGACWCLCFVGFAVAYGRLLLRPRAPS